MIAVDSNVLVYAHFEDFDLHEAARETIIKLAEGSSPWAIPVFCLSEFVRVSTHHRILTKPFSTSEACSAVEALLESPSLLVLLPGPEFTDLFLEATREVGAKANLVFDAQIAALLRESGVDSLLTEDRDFDRFRDLEIVHIS